MVELVGGGAGGKEAEVNGGGGGRPERRLKLRDEVGMGSGLLALELFFCLLSWLISSWERRLSGRGGNMVEVEEVERLSSILEMELEGGGGGGAVGLWWVGGSSRDPGGGGGGAGWSRFRLFRDLWRSRSEKKEVFFMF